MEVEKALRRSAKKIRDFFTSEKKCWCIPCCVRTKRCLCIKLWVWSQTVFISVLWLLEHGADLETDQKRFLLHFVSSFQCSKLGMKPELQGRKGVILAIYFNVAPSLRQSEPSGTCRGWWDSVKTRWAATENQRLCSSFMFLFSVHKCHVVGITFDFLFFCFSVELAIFTVAIFPGAANDLQVLAARKMYSGAGSDKGRSFLRKSSVPPQNAQKMMKNQVSLVKPTFSTLGRGPKNYNNQQFSLRILHKFTIKIDLLMFSRLNKIIFEAAGHCTWAHGEWEIGTPVGTVLKPQKWPFNQGLFNPWKMMKIREGSMSRPSILP